jgi:hypothetical protein
LKIDALLRQYTGLGLATALLIAGALAGLGVAAGLMFPKFQAEALLQFPERQRPPERTGEDARLPPEPIAANANVVELPLFKRVEGAYESTAQLRNWLVKSGQSATPAGQRLLLQSEQSKFWSAVAVPILPFSKQDQKAFGDIKDASSNQLLGLQIKTDARTEEQAAQMAELMAQYFTAAVIRERIRGWVMAGRVEAQGTVKALGADIVKAEAEIALYTRRVQDMKAILARYPDAARMDARQVVSVNAAEGGERYLSPLAQLVGAESAISQKREEISRLERRIQQRTVLAQYFQKAEALVDASPDTAALIDGLRALVDPAFAGAPATEDWAKEARYRLDGALDNFAAMRTQFGVRTGVRVEPVPSRDPVRLGLLGAALGFMMVAGLGFLKLSLSSLRQESA